ncbi:MAG: ABC transporter permease [Acholeplasmatales bacterium]|nr:ABC transporter permease [Acholeplasmatales bacterium]
MNISTYFKSKINSIKRNSADYKKLILGFLIATTLFVLNLVFAIVLDYKTSHKYIYPNNTYIMFLIIFEIYYLIMFVTKKRKSVSDVAIVFFSFLLIWELSYKLGKTHNDLLIPAPEGLFHIYKEKKEEITDGIIASIKLLTFGIIIALVFGVVLGLLAGFIPRVREVIMPIANVISPIPPLIYTPYVVMIAPTFYVASVFVIFSSVFWPTLTQTINSVKSIDKKVIDAAKTMGVSTPQMLFKVIFPYILPSIIVGLSRSLRAAFLCLTGAEMLGASAGLGFFIKTYERNLDFRAILAGILVLALVVSVIDILVKKLEKRVIKWSYS